MLTATAINPDLSRLLSDYADQLLQIQISVATLAKDAGEHKEVVSYVVSSVRSASSVARSASAVICSKELHEQHIARVKKIAQRLRTGIK